MKQVIRPLAGLAFLLCLGSLPPGLRADTDSGEKSESGKETLEVAAGVEEAEGEDAGTTEAGSSRVTLPLVFEFQPVQSVPGAPRPQGTNAFDGSWFLEWRVRANDTDLKGNPDRSFLNPGGNKHGEVTLLRRAPIWDFRELEVMGLYRYTDDPRVDPEVNSLQRGHVRFSGPSFQLNLGDYLTNYSRFSFNQNTKGLNLWKQFESLKITGTAGVFIDRWGSIFKGFEAFADPRQPLVPLLDEFGNPILDPVTGAPVLGPDPANPNKPYTRFVAGYRMEQRMGESSFVAMNFVHAADIKRSLPREAQLQPVNNDVLSFDADFRGGRNFKLAGELALGRTSFDSRIQPDPVRNYAGRFEISHRLPRFSWRVDFARFMPNFFAANARQVQDLQDLSARATLDLGTHTVLDFSLRQTNDNLSGRPVVIRDPATALLRALTNPNRVPDLDGDNLIDLDEIQNFISDVNLERMTTTVRTPEARLSFRSLPPRGIMNINLGYRERRFRTSNQGSFDPVTLEPLFLERVTRIPFLDLEWNGQSTMIGLSYEYRQNRDRVRTVNTTFTNRLMGNYRGTYFLGNWVVGAMFRFETEPEAKSIECTPQDQEDFTGNLSPCFLGPALDFPARDQTRSYTGSLDVDFPKYLRFELHFRELNAKLLTSYNQDRVDVNGTTVNARFFGNGGYRRPYGRAALTYKFANSEDVQLIASYERGVNSFFNPDPAATVDDRSFREAVMQLEFIWRINR